MEVTQVAPFVIRITRTDTGELVQDRMLGEYVVQHTLLLPLDASNVPVGHRVSINGKVWFILEGGERAGLLHLFRFERVYIGGDALVFEECRCLDSHEWPVFNDALVYRIEIVFGGVRL